ncbi:MAG: hypothetical protein RLZ37_166 [Actinomycetota bacterium]|jgi:hypothetical protein
MDANSWERRANRAADPLSEQPNSLRNSDELPHDLCAVEEWDFGWWSPDGEIAGYTSYRLQGRAQVWYCWALWRRHEPLLHVTEFDITRRSNPMIAKASVLWAEYTCDAPFEQWTLGNETYAVELDDPADGLGRAYGKAVPIASDLEWYATADPVSIQDCGNQDGYTQAGRLLGTVETIEGPLELADLQASRTHRWSRTSELVGTESKPIVAHLGPRMPFRFPDGTTRDLYLTPEGLRSASSL